MSEQKHMRQDTFIFHRSWIDAIAELDESARLPVIEGIINYCLDGVEPTDSLARFAFQLVKPMIDKTYEIRVKKQAAGRSGGNASAEARKATEANRSKSQAEGKQNEAKAKQNEANRSKSQAEGKLNCTIGKLDNCKINNIYSVGQPDAKYPYAEVVRYMNEKTGKSFQHQSKNTRSHIKARFDEGYTLEDFKRVIDNKCAEWKDDARMASFLRPNTLFSAGHFEEYLNQKAVKPKSKNQFNNFNQREYDFDDLEAQLFKQQFGGANG